MINIAIVGVSAEKRLALVEMIASFQRQTFQSFLPELNLRPISPEEITFISTPDICILEEAYVSRDLMEIGRLKKLLPHTSFIAELSDKLKNFFIIEQLARLGVNDTFTKEVSAEEFFRKIIFLTKSKDKKKENSGQLILVEGAKGGSGATTVTAALAEYYYSIGKRVLLIDGDYHTQQLSRFLQAKPSINENLEVLFKMQRPVVQETIEQCIVSLSEDDSFCCMPPLALTATKEILPAAFSKISLSILEILDSLFDIVLIDCAALPSLIKQVLYRVSDKILIVSSRDPAALLTLHQRILNCSHCAPEGEISVVTNEVTRQQLPIKFFRHELDRVAPLKSFYWIDFEIPFCKKAFRWAASGHTAFQEGSRSFSKAIESLGNKLYQDSGEKTTKSALIQKSQKPQKLIPFIPQRIDTRDSDVQKNTPYPEQSLESRDDDFLVSDALIDCELIEDSHLVITPQEEILEEAIAK